MDTVSKIKLEWIPEAYKASQQGDNNSKELEVVTRQAIPNNGLYGYRKKQPDRLRRAKK